MKKEFITVVSGLPRSGTSMMMQMLVAGGIPAMTDHVRSADPDNPHGYLEAERVRRLKVDASWLPEAAGMAVKIVSPLLPHLPVDLNCRVLFMERDTAEILKSQRAMLERTGKPYAEIPDEVMGRAFYNQVAEAKKMLGLRNTPVLYLNHRRVIQDPESAAGVIDRFLGGGLDSGKMAGAVRPELHRQKTGE